MELNNEKIILDLCGGTGSWARPYKEAGYKVITITFPKYNVLNYIIAGNLIYFESSDYHLKIDMNKIHGVLAAPPCTMFSDARTNAKTPRDLRGGMQTVIACLDIIHQIQYRTKTDQQKTSPLKFWALENPFYGRLKWFLGNPIFTFDPWEFGDNYKKRTALWGYFKPPVKTHLDVLEVMTNSRALPKFDKMESKNIHPEFFGKLDRQARRSITPAGFANAFFKAN